MTDKTDFTPEEWKLLLESVMMAGIAVSAAEPSGLWGLLKESFASGNAPLGVGIPSLDFTSENVFSSLMMSMHSSTHSSQTNTVGPAMSLRTSCWLLPQNEQ